MPILIAADTGGTFTDVAVYDAGSHAVRYAKVLTNYQDLVEGVLDGLHATGVRLADAIVFKHGTTHVINTFIQRTGARTALIATRGYRDTLEIGRGNRPIPFALEYRRDPPLVPRERRYEVDERIDARGAVVRALDAKALGALADRLREDRIEAVAVSFLNAYANPAHEDQALRILRERLPGVFVTSGTALTREWFEYERTSTAAANAYVGAQIASYIRRFDGRLRGEGLRRAFYMMGSNGGVLSVSRALAQPVALVESGPIGGCIGAAALARSLSIPRLIAFDMGGTTAKCALVQEGKFEVQPVYYVGGYERGFPLRTPVLDIVEVGAGGGSIAAVDEHGRLTVGPRSAGSDPGPVAYRRGGVEPTVTDACAALGQIGGDAFIGGGLPLDPGASRRSLRERIAAPLGYRGEAGLDLAAQGVLDFAVAAMANAIREITIERGHDVREFALLAFGGGGPLFGSVLARKLHIPEVIVPPHPGNFSSLGMLIAGARIDLSRTFVAAASGEALAKLGGAFAELEAQALASFESELGTRAVAFERMLEMRYRGQKYTVRVPYAPGDTLDAMAALFERSYRRRYGHANADCAVEILGLRLGAEAEIPRPEFARLSGLSARGAPSPLARRPVYFPEPCGRIETPLWRRDMLPAGFALEGPAIIEEYGATTVLQPGDRARVGAFGELAIRRPEGA